MPYYLTINQYVYQIIIFTILYNNAYGISPIYFIAQPTTIQNKKMINKLQVGSPRNVTVNILNGNNFFSFDYQPSQQRHKIVPMYQTISHFLSNHSSKQSNPIPKIKQPQYRINDNNSVKTAQYSRKLIQSNVMNRFSLNPYTRIKRVQHIIQQRKTRQSSFDNKQKNTTQLPYVGLNQCFTQRVHFSQEKQKEICLKSLVLDPQNVNKYVEFNKNGYDSMKPKNSKTINVFSENYKNRRKLLDKVTHRKGVSGHMSPLRWDSKPSDIINSEQKNKQKYWSPYSGKLVHKKNDILVKSIEGNKIRYAHHQPKDFKGKLQQIVQI